MKNKWFDASLNHLGPAPMVSEVVGNGCKMILTTFYYTLVLWKNAPKCIPWAGDDPVLLLAVAGPHGVRGGRKWVQNDPDDFLLYPCVMKKCSKVHPLGWGWPCSSPGCISGGHHRPDKFFSFSTPVNLPEHEESGQGHVSVLVNLTFDLVAQC